MALELCGLTKDFGTLRAVEDFSLHVERGSCVALVGPSGCGKTTMLRMVGGFERPSRGRVLLDGTDLTAWPPERRPTATVFQNYALFPHLSVLDNVTYGLRIRGIPPRLRKEQGERMLDLVGLSRYHASAVHHLSGGEQQRVALARALVLQPEVLLLDEPLSNLDARLRISMRHEIRALQQQLGITMLFVTHDQEEALSMADRVAVLSRGRLEQEGTPETIYARPATPFVANFIGRVNRISFGEKRCWVRPEGLELRRRDGGLPGIIRQRQFLGASVTYFVALENGDAVEVDVFSGGGAETWQPGERVFVRVVPEGILPLEEPPRAE